MSTTISNTVSSHELDTSSLVPSLPNLGRESTYPLLPAIIDLNPHSLSDDTPPYVEVLAEDAPDFTKSEHFTLVAPFPTLTDEIENRVEVLGDPKALQLNIMSSILIGGVIDDRAITDRPIEIEDDYHHWSPKSQSYAPAHVLLQYLQNGWKINNRVIVEVFPCLSRQCVELYCFMLLRDKEHITVPIVANPLVLRLTREHNLTLIRICDDREKSEP